MIWVFLVSAVAAWLTAEYAHGLARRTRNEADYEWSAVRRKALYQLADRIDKAQKLAVLVLGIDLALTLYYFAISGGILKQ